MPPIKEKPTEAFEKLRQSFDVLKANHSDPWCWHEYLNPEPAEQDGDGDQYDPEMIQLRPKPRKNVDRLKQHLLACVNELNRAAQGADLCYFQMCCNPQEMRDCVTIMGTAGDVDADLLLASGDGSPQKLLAALQKKLDQAHENIQNLKNERSDLRDKLVETRTSSKNHFLRWQESAMLAEEAITRLHHTKLNLDSSLYRENQLQIEYDNLHLKMVRAARLMIYRSRLVLRDKIFNANKKENLFYSFHGFCNILQMEKEERLRREHEEQRDAVEFALRNEVRYLLNEASLHAGAIQRIAVESCNLKKDRREFACRILYKQRPYETREYFLWVWELWQPLRHQLVLEKMLQNEQAVRDATAQQLVHTSAHIPPMVYRIDELKRSLAAERIAHDISRRELTAAGATQFASLVERLRTHRNEELIVLARLHQIDIEAKDERIAVLEREIAEDKHIHALKGMVVDLESNLKKALDKRKQRGFVVPPGAGVKCAHCSRETLFRGWKGMPQALSHSASDKGLGREASSLSSWPSTMTMGTSTQPWPNPGEKKATYTALWR